MGGEDWGGLDLTALAVALLHPSDGIERAEQLDRKQKFTWVDGAVGR